ncbi:Glycerophosphoryl diester phosphodiesterase [hydrothermal vent metagenome]|uniref:Glycerophosphoryl diester phosphodiesterase n=1 Tax=hydrothermal vent metagenome TaxID=652676 RepID=A0A3B0TI55_9ZZZZ
MTRTSASRITLVLAAVLVAGACQGAPAVPESEAPPETVAPPTTAIETPETDFDLQGHRGARGLQPENTLPSFETALDIGVTTLELDLHFSADGEVVIWHDATIDPAKCGLEPGAPSDIPDPDDPGVDTATLAIRSLSVDQLRWFRCDRNPDPAKFSDQNPTPTDIAGDSYGIVALDDLFDLVERYAQDSGKTSVQRDGAKIVQFNVETKRDRRDPGAIGDGFDGENVGPFEERLLEVIARRQMGPRVMIQSFDPRSLLAIADVDPEIRLVMLTAAGSPDFQELATEGIWGWSPNASTVTVELVAEAHDAGLTVVPWTVNDPGVARTLLDAGVDGIITDRPDRFVED